MAEGEDRYGEDGEEFEGDVDGGVVGGVEGAEDVADGAGADEDEDEQEREDGGGEAEAGPVAAEAVEDEGGGGEDEDEQRGGGEVAEVGFLGGGFAVGEEAEEFEGEELEVELLVQSQRGEEAGGGVPEEAAGREGFGAGGEVAGD